MIRESRTQPLNKESQPRTKSKRDEIEKTLSPDADFPVESNGTGGQK
ncbi:MAG TPA: hypothetical protein VNM90_01090 [Haliangium sp.]|nr:hypothetical protein [Haliangium sp.]